MKNIGKIKASSTLFQCEEVGESEKYQFNVLIDDLKSKYGDISVLKYMH